MFNSMIYITNKPKMPKVTNASDVNPPALR